MFYNNNLDKELRFGDVVKGFISTLPELKQPILKFPTDKDYNIKITMPHFSVVLSPCCSIENGKICLAPLKQIKSSLIINPYIRADLTRINNVIAPADLLNLPDDELAKITPEEKAATLSKEPEYEFVELFVYAENEIFPIYEVKYKDQSVNTRCHMIDFRDIHRIDCKVITKDDISACAVKCLQLSLEARNDLRGKIVNYFNRAPEVDKLLLGSS